MSSLTHQQLKSIINNTPIKDEPFNIFVETGTNAGFTVDNMKSHFKEVHTIELSEPYYDSAVNKFKSDENVKLYLGDSAKVLPDLVKELDGNTVFFLDGHWSGGDTAQGDKDCPLVEELVAIKEFKHKSIVVIDDYRMFGTKGNEDWSDITDNTIKESVKDRLVHTNSENDRLILVLK
jgi:hypothetical protein